MKISNKAGIFLCKKCKQAQNMLIKWLFQLTLTFASNEVRKLYTGKIVKYLHMYVNIPTK